MGLLLTPWKRSGARLKEYRLRAALGLPRFARLVGWDACNACAVEAGRLKFPLKRLEMVSAVLQLTEEEKLSLIDWDAYKVADVARGRPLLGEVLKLLPTLPDDILKVWLDWINERLVASNSGPAR